jgi:diamine N-acetyltransferase
MQKNQNEKQILQLMPVDASNWRKVIRIKVKPAQQDFVADPSYYLLLCHYGELWQPLAVMLHDQAVGFLMWGIDPEDGSCWLGGFQIDEAWQRQGYGRANAS